MVLVGGRTFVQSQRPGPRLPMYGEISDPLTDPLRLDALDRSGLMDSPPEEVFDRLTRLASRLLGTEIASMTLIDGSRQFFKSGICLDPRETPLPRSFCRYVVEDGVPLVISDAREDPRLRDHEATRDGSVIAYAGMSLVDADGHVLGSFCAASPTPRRGASTDTAPQRSSARRMPPGCRPAAEATPADPARAQEAGVEDQIRMPLRPSRLYNQLVATIYRVRARATQPGAALPAVPPAAAPASSPDPEASAGRAGVHVLVADDNEVNRFAAIRLLQAHGFNVDEIDDPETEAALAMMFLDQATERIPALLDAIDQLARALCEIAEGARDSDPDEIHSQLAHALDHSRSALDSYIAGASAGD